jgi:hypothetical protein
VETVIFFFFKGGKTSSLRKLVHVDMGEFSQILGDLKTRISWLSHHKNQMSYCSGYQVYIISHILRTTIVQVFQSSLSFVLLAIVCCDRVSVGKCLLDKHHSLATTSPSLHFGNDARPGDDRQKLLEYHELQFPRVVIDKWLTHYAPFGDGFVAVLLLIFIHDTLIIRSKLS